VTCPASFHNSHAARAFPERAASVIIALPHAPPGNRVTLITQPITMKMYILVRDDIPLGFAMVAVAHASLAGYLKFRESPEVKEWLAGPFFKAVCKVNPKEFENAKLVEDHLVLTESALENQEVAIVFRPRKEWPKMFKYLKLYREAPLPPPPISQGT
jgi:hypothetical protein